MGAFQRRQGQSFADHAAVVAAILLQRVAGIEDLAACGVGALRRADLDEAGGETYGLASSDPPAFIATEPDAVADLVFVQRAAATSADRDRRRVGWLP